MKCSKLHQQAHKVASTLSAQQVHIWQVPFMQFAHDLAILSVDEKKRAMRYKFAIHRQRFIAYRVALRQILAGYYNTEPSKLAFSYTAYNKPYLDLAELQFNLSHSKNMMVLGITKHCTIGIDIEIIKANHALMDIAKQYFCDLEYQKLKLVPTLDQQACFYELWTRKEAFIKAIGTGLSYPLDHFAVSCHDDLPARILHINGNRENSQWNMHSLDLVYQDDQYKLACVVNNPKAKFIEIPRFYATS